jgi:hypothetical protein
VLSLCLFGTVPLRPFGVQLRQLELAHYYDRLFNDGPRAMLQVRT